MRVQSPALLCGFEDLVFPQLWLKSDPLPGNPICLRVAKKEEKKKKRKKEKCLDSIFAIQSLGIR